jgi:tetratricopeptide (TPR) repeat protein
MSRGRDSHLNRDEIARLVEEVESALMSPTPGSTSELSDHATACPACGLEVHAQRAVHTSVKGLVSSVTSERTSDCPSEEKWLPLSAGVFSRQDAAPLLEHASSCDYCGRLLRETTEALAPEQSDQSRDVVRQLASSDPRWQRELALRLRDLSLPAREAARSQTPSAFDRVWPHLAGKWTRWVLVGASALLMALGIGLWVESTRSSLLATNRLIAQAYSEQRTLVPRFEDARYGPLRQERGELNSQIDLPQALKDAKVQIAGELSRNSTNPGWLQAKARVDLLEHHHQAAIEALQQAVTSLPDDSSLNVDLAIAYFERAEATGQAEDYERASQLLNRALEKNPTDIVALFNRALVDEGSKKYSEAIRDWDRYLGLDPESEWADEAKRRREVDRQRKTTLRD